MNKIFLNLGTQPLANNFQKKKVKEFYKLSLKFNTINNLVSINKRFKKEVMFNKTYPYRSSQSLLVKKHFKELSKKIRKNYQFKRILEIGSNDGSLLNYLKKKNLEVIGVEPTNISKIANENGIKTIQSFFNEETVTC